MIINTFIHLSLYIHVYVCIMYIFPAFMIQICRFMSVYILAMINMMSIQLYMFVAYVIMDLQMHIPILVYIMFNKAS